MKTELYSALDPENAGRAIAACAEILRRGGLVAFPTETVYGLGADALKPEAVRAIFAAKGRPADNPLIVHTADAEQAFSLAARVTPLAKALAAAFWPGPLTLVLPRAPHVPDEVTAGLDTVALRVPDHQVALALLKAFGGAVAAPSANASGRPSPTRAAHVLEDLAGRIDAVLDGGETGVGLESTVVDARGPRPRVLRLGGLPVEAIAAAAGVDADWAGPAEAGDGPARSPGQKYRHYAPAAPVTVVVGGEADVRRALAGLKAEDVAFLVTEETAAALGFADGDPRCFVLGRRDDAAAIGRRLYDGLRRLDRLRPSAIYAEDLAGPGLGSTLADRLYRAAEGRLVTAATVLKRLREARDGGCAGHE